MVNPIIPHLSPADVADFRDVIAAHRPLLGAGMGFLLDGCERRIERFTQDACPCYQLAESLHIYSGLTEALKDHHFDAQTHQKIYNFSAELLDTLIVKANQDQRVSLICEAILHPEQEIDVPYPPGGPLPH